MSQEIVWESLISNIVFMLGGSFIGFALTVFYSNSIAPDLFVGKRFRLITGGGQLVYSLRGLRFVDGNDEELLIADDFYIPTDDDFVSFSFKDVLLVVTNRRAKIKGILTLINKRKEHFNATLFGDGRFDSNSKEHTTSGVIYFDVRLCCLKPGGDEKVSWNALYIANIDDIYNNGRGYWYTKDRDSPRAFAFGVFQYESQSVRISKWEKVKAMFGVYNY